MDTLPDHRIQFYLYFTQTLPMPGLSLPPFPDSVPTHPLLVVDYDLIKKGDEQECEKLWKAATGLGFW